MVYDRSFINFEGHPVDLQATQPRIPERLFNSRFDSWEMFLSGACQLCPGLLACPLLTRLFRGSVGPTAPLAVNAWLKSVLLKPCKLPSERANAFGSMKLVVLLRL